MAVFILPPKTVVTPSLFSPVGAATIPLACDPLDEVHDDDASYAARGSGGGANLTLGLRHDLGFRQRMSAISSVKIKSRARRTDLSDVNFNLRMLLGGNTSTSGALALTASYVTREYDVSRPGGGSWTESDLRDPTLEFQLILPSNPPTSRITSLYLHVTFTPLAVSVEQHRLVASQVLFARLRQLFVSMELPLRFMDLDVLEDFALSHRQSPTAEGTGHGMKRWERRVLEALRVDVDPMTNRVNVMAWDPKSYRALLADIGQSKVSTAMPTIADGIARLSTGGRREFARASKAYGLNVAGDRIVEFGIDQEAIIQAGMLLERASTSRIWNSVFNLGFTNWTLINNGVDGVSVTLDTAKVLFDPTPEITTRQSVRILTGTTTAGGFEQITNTSIGATSKNTVSVQHDDDAGSQLAVRVRNETTGNWLQSNGTWAGSEVNAVTFAERSSATRDYLHFTTEGTASTLRIKLMGVNTPAKIAHVYHVQLESGPPTSEIVTGSADKTRSVSQFKFSNNFGKRVLWTAHGHAVFTVIPNFADSELAAGEEKMIARAGYDGSNSDELLYIQGTGFAFRRTVSAAAVTAAKATTAIRGTIYRVAFRWTGDEGELGVSDYTLSVFVDGVKGADAVAGGAPVPPSTMDLWIGQNGSDAKAVDAVIRRIKSSPFVLTDKEMARL